MFEEQIAAIGAATNFLCGILHFKSLDKAGVCQACGKPLFRGKKVYTVIPTGKNGEKGEEHLFCCLQCRGEHAEKCFQIIQNQVA